MSYKQSVNIPISTQSLQSTFIEEADNKDTFVLPSGPKPVGHTTFQHLNDSDFIYNPEPSKTPVPWLSNDLDEDDKPSNPDDDSLPSLCDPEHGFFGKTTPPSISLIGAAAFKQMIAAGEEVYTINIQLTSDYLDIKACKPLATNPLPCLL